MWHAGAAARKQLMRVIDAGRVVLLYTNANPFGLLVQPAQTIIIIVEIKKLPLLFTGYSGLCPYCGF